MKEDSTVRFKEERSKIRCFTYCKLFESIMICRGGGDRVRGLRTCGIGKGGSGWSFGGPGSCQTIRYSSHDLLGTMLALEITDSSISSLNISVLLFLLSL